MRSGEPFHHDSAPDFEQHRPITTIDRPRTMRHLPDFALALALPSVLLALKDNPWACLVVALLGGYAIHRLTPRD